MKKSIMALCFAGCLALFATAAVAGDTIKIGTMYPMSGALSALGKNAVRGVEFAAEEINAKGGVLGKKIEIVYGDTQGDPKIGRSLAEQLISREKCVGLIGCIQSIITEIAAQVAEQNKVPFITAISTVDQITTRGYTYFFRLAPTNSLYLRSMVDYVLDVGKKNGKEVKNLAVVADNTFLGQETVRWAKYWAEQRGVKVVKEVLYAKDATDLSSEVLALKEANADALLADSYISDAILLTRTMAEQGYKPAIMVAKATGFVDPTYLPNAGAAANGISTCVEWNHDLTKGGEINKRFKERYGVDMNGHTAQTYQTLWMFKTAIEQAKSTDGTKVRDVLDKIKVTGTFPGGYPEVILPYDTISFDDIELVGAKHTNTNMNANLGIAQFQDGVLKTVWPFAFTKNSVAYPAQYK